MNFRRLSAVLAVFLCAGHVLAGPPGVGLDIAGMDRAVAAGDDFFEHANGSWLKATEIPADRGSISMWVVMAELTSKRNAEIIQQAGPTSGKAPHVAVRRCGWWALVYFTPATWVAPATSMKIGLL